jgi:hypothetical protein
MAKNRNRNGRKLKQKNKNRNGRKLKIGSWFKGTMAKMVESLK